MSTEIATEPIQTAVNRQDQFEEEATKIIGKYTLISTGGGIIPIPGVDVIAGAASQVLMVRELCQLYGVPYEDQLMNVAIYSGIGSVLTKAASYAISMAINKENDDTQPNLTQAALAGMYTAAIGEFYKIHLRDGGSLDTISITDFGSYFVDEIKRGNLSVDSFTNPTELMKQLF